MIYIYVYCLSMEIKRLWVLYFIRYSTYICITYVLLGWEWWVGCNLEYIIIICSRTTTLQKWHCNSTKWTPDPGQSHVAAVVVAVVERSKTLCVMKNWFASGIPVRTHHHTEGKGGGEKNDHHIRRSRTILRMLHRKSIWSNLEKWGELGWADK